MSNNKGLKSWSIHQVDTGLPGDSRIHTSARSDALVVEEPLEIRLYNEPIAVVMRTPGHDDALAAGFVFTEGIAEAADIRGVQPCKKVEPERAENTLQVLLRPGTSVDLESVTRRTYAGSSCGVCGKSTMASIFVRRPPLESDARVRPEVLSQLGARLREEQALFEETGGLHAAGLFDLSGGLITLAEDVGRHNAVDKVIGRHVLQNSVPLSERILMVSGRLSFEIVQKAHVAGIPVVVAVSAPSSMAVEFADVSQQTLVAFARGQSFNVYTHSERVLDP